jgi:FixJ family two-component response regulator
MWHAIQSLFSNVSTFVERKKITPGSRASHRVNNPGPGPITVAGLVMDERDRASLSSLEEHDQWHVRFEDSHSWSALSKLESPIIIWDRDLPCEDWRDVVHMLASLPQRPCVLFLSRVVDDYLWNEVVRVGGYDVLSKPLKDAEVLRAVRLAWSYWASTATTSARPASTK